MTIELALRVRNMTKAEIERLIVEMGWKCLPSEAIDEANDTLATAYEQQAKELAALKGRICENCDNWLAEFAWPTFGVCYAGGGNVGHGFGCNAWTPKKDTA